MVSFPVPLTDPQTGFQGHGIFEVEYLKLTVSCYYKHTNRKPYVTYRIVQCLVTLTDL